jgi:hypothetical protein
MIGLAGQEGSRPSIGVAGDHFPAPLIQLLGEVGRWCHVMALTADVTGPLDAVVARRPALLDAPGVVAATPGRVAVWVDGEEELDDSRVAGADLILSDQSSVLDRTGAPSLLVPTGAEFPTARWVAPHVRSRIRAAGGLPALLVVEHDGADWRVWPTGRRLAAEGAETALACASAAVATDPARLLTALAWGTPTVTDRDSAAAVGADVGVHVLVADSVDQRRQMGRRVAADLAVAARLSTRGRQLVETRHSPRRAAACLVRRLGLGPAAPFALPDPLSARLGEFDTPSSAVVAGRAARAAEALTDARTIAPHATD